MPIDLSEHELNIAVRPLTKADFDQIVDLQLRCFPGMEPWTRQQFESQIDTFPEGQLCVVCDDQIVASSSSLIVEYDLYADWHDWTTIADEGAISNHDPHGDMLYGIEIMVHPDYRGMRLARRLYDARKQLVRDRNLKGIVIGGRIPNYSKYRDELSAHEYVQKVVDRAIYDPVLTTQLANDFELRQIIPDYLPSDEDSAGWATHMEWTNVDYRPLKKRAIQPVQIVRLGAVQYQMRPIADFDEFAQQVRFFVSTGSAYHCDFLLFPELFTTQLLSFCDEKRPGRAARKLASFTPQYLDLFTTLAVQNHVNIIGGSTFLIEDDKLYNVAFLFRRDGTIEKQYKIHATPTEGRWWGVTGGDRIKIFDTDCGRIAILICYDVEFPEAARVIAKKGARLLFVPYNTDERSGHLRVRICAQARCIENHLAAVLAGCTGNLPQAPTSDIHYAQSCILTPADIAFSRDAVAADSTPNIETIVMQDIDVEQLRRHRFKGTTQNWLDRHKTMYRLSYFEDGRETVI